MSDMPKGWKDDTAYANHAERRPCTYRAVRNDGLEATYTWECSGFCGYDYADVDLRKPGVVLARRRYPANTRNALLGEIDIDFPVAVLPAPWAICPPWLYGDYPGWGPVEHYGCSVRKRRRLADGWEVAWDARTWQASNSCAQIKVGPAWYNVHHAAYPSVCAIADRGVVAITAPPPKPLPAEPAEPAFPYFARLRSHFATDAAGMFTAGYLVAVTGDSAGRGVQNARRCIALTPGCLAVVALPLSILEPL